MMEQTKMRQAGTMRHMISVMIRRNNFGRRKCSKGITGLI